VQKIFLVGIAAAGLLSGSAFASDLPTKAPEYKAPIAAPYNWSGFYVGANFGGGWSNGSLNIPGNNLYGGLSEFIGGVQAGYNFEAGHFLFGVEGEFDGATFGHPALPTPTLGSVSQNWIGTIAGRVGLVEDRWLVYGKLGGGWVHSNALLNFPGVSWIGSNTSSGWLAGVGLEYGFKSHWTVRLEYDYLALSNWTSPTVPSVQLNRDLQMVKAGINYKFESGLPDTVAPTRTGSAEHLQDEDLAKKSQNPIADLVIGQLIVASDAPAGRLAATLSTIAGIARSHVTQRLDIEADRAPVRTELRLVLTLTVVLIGGLKLLRPQFLVSYGHPVGEFVLLAVGGLFALGLGLMAAMARDARPPRVMTGPPPTGPYTDTAGGRR